MENIIEIAGSIESHTKEEKQLNVANRSIGRSVIDLKNNTTKLIWLTNREQLSTSNIDRNVTGRIVGASSSGLVDTLNKPEGCVCVSKNTQYGKILSSNDEGNHTVNFNGKKISFSIVNNSRYNQNYGEIQDLKIHVSGKPSAYYKSMKHLLDAYKSLGVKSKEIEDQIYKHKQKKEQELKDIQEKNKAIEEALTKKISTERDLNKQKTLEEKYKREREAQDEEQSRRDQAEQAEIERLENRKRELREALDSLDEQYRNATKFIRRHAELRRQPLLDRKQNDAKFSNIYNSKALVIDGGPGTGKTTTLIQRLKLLIEREALEDLQDNDSSFSLTNKQLGVITNRQQDWIFFSPTELLRLYLKDNMSYEGLINVEEKTHVWSDYIRKVARDHYELAGDSKPFKFATKSISQKGLFKNDYSTLISGFSNYYIDYIHRKINKLLQCETSKYKWNVVAELIKKQAKDYLLSPSIDKLILLFVNLNELPLKAQINDANNINLIVSSYYSEIKEVSLDIFAKVKSNNVIYQDLQKLIREWQKKSISTMTTEDDADEDEFEDENTPMDNIDLIIDSKIRGLVATLARVQGGVQSKISPLNNNIYELLEDFVDIKKIENLGNSAYFIKYIFGFTKGIGHNLLNDLSRVYKSFRVEALKSKSNCYDQEILDTIVKEKRNSILHSDECSLLIGFTNELLRSIYKVSKSSFELLSHKYANAYKKLCYPVIGVDEATDYTVVDYYAIFSFRHYLISSITLSGDKMQCLESRGIKDWHDLSVVIPNFDVVELTTSYRQSQRIMDLGLILYKSVIGRDAPYTCHIADENDVPYPIYVQSDDEQDKADWIVERILEVKQAYGFLPSIAIFLNDPSKIARFKDLLEENDRLEENGIEVKDCSSGDLLTRNDTIRLFPLSKVKGMEFEVVFFHNLDELLNQGKDDLLNRYLYVGLSRATFYLGVTFSSVSDDHLQALMPCFRESDWTTIIE